MKDTICLITGGNAGIGKATATGLAKKGAAVIIVARNENKAKAAVEAIRKESGNEKVSYLLADLSSQKSIRNLAIEYKAKYDRLDVLINNAGVFYSDFQLTEDNVELQFAINHLAPFLLTNLLLDVLKKSAPSRIITVSSRSHFRGKINFEDVNHSKNYEGYLKAYGQSKLANVLFTYELDRRLKGTGVTVNCLHPGVVNTSISLSNSNFTGKLFWLFSRPFMLTPEGGAKTSIYLASSPEVNGISGKYFDKCKAKRSSDISYDENVAGKLWRLSEEMVGLKS